MAVEALKAIVGDYRRVLALVEPLSYRRAEVDFDSAWMATRDVHSRAVGSMRYAVTRRTSALLGIGLHTSVPAAYWSNAHQFTRVASVLAHLLVVDETNTKVDEKTETADAMLDLELSNPMFDLPKATVLTLDGALQAIANATASVRHGILADYPSAYVGSLPLDYFPGESPFDDEAEYSPNAEDLPVGAALYVPVWSELVIVDRFTKAFSLNCPPGELPAGPALVRGARNLRDLHWVLQRAGPSEGEENAMRFLEPSPGYQANAPADGNESLLFPYRVRAEDREFRLCLGYILSLCGVGSEWHASTRDTGSVHAIHVA